MKPAPRDIVLVLHNLRSVHNVGAIFRTADAIGVREIVLTGYTPAPVDRFGNARKAFAKTALGAERSVPWRKFARIAPVLQQLRRNGYALIAVEQAAGSIHYRQARPSRKAAVVLGNEVRGLSAAAVGACDAVVEIPMRGAKESLNVAVAAGVVLYGLFE